MRLACGRRARVLSQWQHERPASKQVQWLASTETQHDAVARPRHLSAWQVLGAVLNEIRIGGSCDLQQLRGSVTDAKQVDRQDRHGTRGKRGSKLRAVIAPAVGRDVDEPGPDVREYAGGNQVRATVSGKDHFRFRKDTTPPEMHDRCRERLRARFE